MVEEVEVEELKSSVTKCVMCKVGKVSPVTRTGRTKADLVIYGRSGMRMAQHQIVLVFSSRSRELIKVTFLDQKRPRR